LVSLNLEFQLQLMFLFSFPALFGVLKSDEVVVVEKTHATDCSEGTDSENA